MSEQLRFGGINFAHERLLELSKLADQAKPFYDWIETKFQEVLKRKASLQTLIMESTQDQIKAAIKCCYLSSEKGKTPLLADGAGKSYSHLRACYYFFSWIIRDAPQQRLSGMITRAAKAEKKSKRDMEVDVLAALISEYKAHVKTFGWSAIREIIIDRLEGSRRSLKGHEKEAIARSALLAAIQKFFSQHKNYGVFAEVEIAEKQIIVGGETYDVSAALKDERGKVVSRILVPVKTRETEGGGHAHLYTRDVGQAFQAAKTEGENYLITLIVARQWSNAEREKMLNFVDQLIYLDMSPTEFKSLNGTAQAKLDQFIYAVLSGDVKPKTVQNHKLE